MHPSEMPMTIGAGRGITLIAVTKPGVLDAPRDDSSDSSDSSRSSSESREHTRMDTEVQASAMRVSLSQLQLESHPRQDKELQPAAGDSATPGGPDESLMESNTAAAHENVDQNISDADDESDDLSASDSSSDDDMDSDGSDDSDHGIASARRRFYTDCQWTPDGTTLVTTSSDNVVDIFALPPEVQQQWSAQYSTLQLTTSLRLAEPTCSVGIYPGFDYYTPHTRMILTASKDHPVQMFEVSDTSTCLASVTLQLAGREEYVHASSMLWHWPGDHFVLGSLNRLDLVAVDAGALRPARSHSLKAYSGGMKGFVSAIAAQPSQAPDTPIFAVGTRNRWFGIYDPRYDVDIADTVPIPETASVLGPDFKGTGVTQVAWSACGRYLVVGERACGGMLVYDVRNSRQLLAGLAGRTSSTPQRMSFDVFADGDAGGEGGFEVWSGTENGRVVVWQDVGRHVGRQEPSWGWKAHDAPIGGTSLHPSGTVVATCAGAYVPGPTGGPIVLDDDGEAIVPTTTDRSLKLWGISSEPRAQP